MSRLWEQTWFYSCRNIQYILQLQWITSIGLAKNTEQAIQIYILYTYKFRIFFVWSQTMSIAHPSHSFNLLIFKNSLAAFYTRLTLLLPLKKIRKPTFPHSSIICLSQAVINPDIEGWKINSPTRSFPYLEHSFELTFHLIQRKRSHGF